MDKHKITISEIKLENNFFIIRDNLGKTFTGKIIKGSVDFKVFNENNEEVNISNIEEGDIIKIYTSGIKQSDLKEQKNSIIKKIIIKNKYVFNSDCSSDSELEAEKYFT